MDNSKRHDLWLTVINFLFGIIGFAVMLAYFRQTEWFIQIIGYVCTIGFSFGSIVALVCGRQTWGRSLFVLNLLTFILIIVLCILHLCGLFDDFSNLENLKYLIRSSGGWAYLVYIILQFLNVVLLPLPGFLFMLAALSIFGVWTTFWVTLLVSWVGSMICFWFGRTFGNKAVVWCVGNETAERYKKLLGTKGNLLFLIMQILPFFPDDMLCMIAGLTQMRFSFFLLTMLVAKPLYIAMVCFFGSGSLIPFSGWGILAWILICAALLIAFLVFCKYQTAIENWFVKITHRRIKIDKFDKKEKDL